MKSGVNVCFDMGMARFKTPRPMDPWDIGEAINPDGTGSRGMAVLSLRLSLSLYEQLISVRKD